MNNLSIMVFAAALCVSLLSSCSGTTSNGGQTVRYPTISDMEKLDQNMGVASRQTKPKSRDYSGEVPQPAATAGSAPELLATAPIQPTEPPPATAPVDPATLQKLR